MIHNKVHIKRSGAFGRRSPIPFPPNHFHHFRLRPSLLAKHKLRQGLVTAVRIAIARAARTCSDVLACVMNIQPNGIRSFSRRPQRHQTRSRACRSISAAIAFPSSIGRSGSRSRGLISSWCLTIRDRAPCKPSHFPLRTRCPTFGKKEKHPGVGCQRFRKCAPAKNQINALESKRYSTINSNLSSIRTSHGHPWGVGATNSSRSQMGTDRHRDNAASKVAYEVAYEVAASSGGRRPGSRLGNWQYKSYRCGGDDSLSFLDGERLIRLDVGNGVFSAAGPNNLDANTFGAPWLPQPKSQRQFTLRKVT